MGFFWGSSRSRSSYYSSSYHHRKSNADVRCYKCQGRHYANACTTKCYRCGGSHYVTNCPGRSSSSTPKPTKKAKKKAAACEGMTVKELKAACKERELPVSGLKAVLVKRLQDYFAENNKTSGSRSSQPVVTPAAASASVPPSAVKNDVYSLFNVEEDGDKDMANVVSNFELSQSSSTSSSAPGSEKKIAADAAVVKTESSTVGAIAATAAATPSQPPVSPTTSFSQTLSQTSTSTSMSLSQTSQTSTTSFDSKKKPGAAAAALTEEQRERMKRKREEALQRKKMARLSSCYANSNYGTNNMSQGMSQSPPGESPYNNSTDKVAPVKKKPAFNPYLVKAPIKRDESKREMDLSDLPPLPPNMPPVRENTLKRLSEQQLAVIMAARPPASMMMAVTAANSGGANADVDMSEEKKKIEENGTEQKVQQHHMVRVNAAAGTGKTTTLIHLATRCIDLGHDSITYVTFSRPSAKDAKERMHSELDDHHKHCVNASTLHSCAMRLLSNERKEEYDSDEEEVDKKLYDDNEFQELLHKHWGKDLSEYVKPAMEHLRSLVPKEEDGPKKSAGKEKLIFEKALYYLNKSFHNFLTKEMSVRELEDKDFYMRHYFPLTKVFKENGIAAKLGFPPSHYNHKSSYSFFADTCVKIWHHVEENKIRTFNIELKRAQLKKLKIPTSVLLVDESQDLDEAQVDWLHSQKAFGTYIFFVGDTAQCIYGYRGAKSKFVMNLECADTKLTKSFRFGPDIARMANIALFAKEKSAQTTENTGSKRIWIPYRVEGARKPENVSEGGEEADGSDDIVTGVTTKSLLENWQKYKPLTLIGSTNGGLIVKAMDLLGLGSLKNPNMEDHGEDESSEVGGMESLIDIENLPKFHINGKGEASGSNKWGKASRQIRYLYELYTNRDESGKYLPMTLPVKDFPHFAQEDFVTWDSFHEICQVKEITTYVTAVHVINTYQRNTLRALDSFDSHVLANKCSEEDADIILTTVHAAKGLEWDHVQICDDLMDLSGSFMDSQPPLLRHPSFLKAMPGHVKSESTQENSEASQVNVKSETASVKSETAVPMEISKGDYRKGWQFILSKYATSDAEINKLYVAITRARKTISLPKSIKMLLQDFDHLHFLVEGFKNDASGVGGREVPSSNDESSIMIGMTPKKLTKGEVWNFYHDLCLPLREELGVPGDCMILPSLFPECKDESMENKFEGEQKKPEVKPEGQLDAIKSNNGNVADYFDC